MHAADRATELEHYRQQDRQRAQLEASARELAVLQERQRLLTELLDIANGNCPDHDGGLALVAKTMYDHLVGHP